jgi:spore coat protein A
VPTRRHALRLGLATGVAASVGTAGWWTQAFGTIQAPVMTAGTAAPVTPFSVPLTVPPVLPPYKKNATTDYYEVAMTRVRREILPGTTTELLTYNGSFPGPTIRAHSGRTVVVKQVNKLDMPTSVHLHGGAVQASSDGSSTDTIPPGGNRTYTYPNLQPGATLWMHDHTHHMESEHVYRGLSNLYLLRDDVEAGLPLPSGEFEVPLVVRDAQFDENAQLVYTMDDPLNRTTILVNGRPWPHMKVKARKYRFRMVNSSNLRIFVLRLSDSGQITQIGSDGGLLEKPFTTTVLVLSPGERADFVIDFSRYPQGTQLTLDNLIGPGPTEQIGKVMRFDVGAPAADSSSVPEQLQTLPAMPKPTAERTFELKMDEPSTGNQGYINGKAFDHNRIDTTVAWGTSEVWTVTNASATIPHNFHLHLVQFRVLERDGGPPSPAEAGLKDTVLIFPGQSVKLQVTFDTYRGVFPYHCHMIDHSAMGMMAQLRIE